MSLQLTIGAQDSSAAAKDSGRPALEDRASLKAVRSDGITKSAGYRFPPLLACSFHRAESTPITSSHNVSNPSPMPPMM